MKRRSLTNVAATILPALLCLATDVRGGNVASVDHYRFLAKTKSSDSGFGWSLDAYGSTFSIGAAFTSSLPHHAYVYQENGLTTPEVTLTSPSASTAALFGFDVSVSQDFAVVGSLQEQKSYLYDVHNGNLLRTFTARGDAVSVDGNRVAVGLASDSALNAGTVSLYNAATGILIRQLSPSDYSGSLTGGDQGFGGAVAVDGGTLVVGSSGTTRAYVYDANTGILRTTLTGNERGAFGSVLSADSNRVLVGAPFANRDSGKAYLFDTVTGQKLLEIAPPSGAHNFGNSVYLKDGLALIGAPTSLNTGPNSTGAAYLFNASTGEEIAAFYPDPAHPMQNFGGSVAITDHDLVFGSTANSPTGVFVIAIPEPNAEVLSLSGFWLILASGRRPTKHNRV